MNQSLVRISVLADRRRVDVCLPAEVPVIEVLPDLTRGLGVGVSADPTSGSVHRLVTVGGAALDPERGLRVQGVQDGEVLTLAPGADHAPPRIFDDLVEAVHERARVLFRPWTEPDSASGALLMGCWAGLWGTWLLAASATSATTVLVSVVAAVLVGGFAVATARRAYDGLRHVAPAWLASLVWAAAGSHLAVDLGLGQHRLVAAAVGSGVVAVLCLLVSRTAWPLLAPPVVVAISLVLAQGMAEWWSVAVWEVVLGGVAVGVLGARLLPGLVVETTVLRGQETERGVSSTDAGRRRVQRGPRPPGVDLVALDEDLRTAHWIVLALGVGGSLLLVGVTPSAVRDGLPATGVVAALCGLRLLRLRRLGPHTHVVAGLAGAGATVLAGVVAVWTYRPEWAPWVAAGCVLALPLSSVLARRPGATRRAWWGDLAESAVTVAVPVLLALTLWPGWGG